MGLDMYLNSRIYHSGITYDENNYAVKTKKQHL